MIVALDCNQRVAIFAGECGDAMRKFGGREVAVEFGALQAGVSVNDLSAAVVAVGAATGGINGEEVSVGLWSLAVGFFFTLSGAKGLLFKVVGHWS